VVYTAGLAAVHDMDIGYGIDLDDLDPQHDLTSSGGSYDPDRQHAGVLLKAGDGLAKTSHPGGFRALRDTAPLALGYPRVTVTVSSMVRPKPAGSEAIGMAQLPLPVLGVDDGPLVRGFTVQDLSEVRHAVQAYAERVGLGGESLDDFVVAVHELVTNAVRHGGGSGQVHVRSGGDSVLCDVTDSGPGFAGGIPDVGGEPPPAQTPGGRGLWLARLLTDTLLITDGPGGVTVSVTACLPDTRGLSLAVMEPAVTNTERSVSKPIRSEGDGR
jgi:anti-sigma regulatory factor (Ser/Thr protein kinase)